ncbi:MAG: hypothetical protein KAS26_03465 [Sulfurimonas sp.]|nr:hypothetical protein [Sulfurimonas sp.]
MNNKIIAQTLVLATLAMVFVGCANTDTPKPQVKAAEKAQTKSKEKTKTQASLKPEKKTPKVLPPNYLFDGDYINIYSPNSDGWSVVEKSESKVVVGKRSDKGKYIAEVIFFSILTTGKNEFFDFIQKETSKINNDKRYTVVSSEFKETGKRSYPCVMSKQILKDKKTEKSSTSTDALMTQIKSLYCKDPKSDSIGFMIGYSFRGQKIIKDIDKQADDFIAGVEFP